ncbi:heavy-metal-associated domain-containing protein [Streptomyces heilongjiangensis]|uniref:Heavy-metal-associated domain-containing protein n=1 Tax=Streptomyces heilongjiangensis TaxID=945052 RepID=A0ABW1BFU1_9ACTN|nr:heavy-metal-associated domain-containing protein [Streptomyces heilongjiangensis]MDC2950474.1 heavy-metal-associated domain-containing protein [Streptomyces heilongjiangensis]
MSSCCTPDGSCSTSAASTVTVEGTVTATVYKVAGMTCGHCKSTLTREIGTLDGILQVDVDVAAGLVTVTTSEEPDDQKLAAVVEEAGYELTGRAA